MLRPILAFALLLTACDKSHKTPDQRPSAAGAAQTPADPAAPRGTPTGVPEGSSKPPGVTDDHGVTRHDKLVDGKPRAGWVDTWGPSDEQLTFWVKDGPHEYQIELLNVFRPDDPQTQKVEIHEDTWDEDGYTFVLWSFRKSPDAEWVAVQAMSYEDGIEF